MSFTEVANSKVSEFCFVLERFITIIIEIKIIMIVSKLAPPKATCVKEKFVSVVGSDSIVGAVIGLLDGLRVGKPVGESVGASVGDSVGASVGQLLLHKKCCSVSHVMSL